MKELGTKISITYRWWNDNETEMNLEHVDRLEQDAEARIKEMREEGYTSGELLTEIDRVDYRGWWELKTERL